MKDKLFLGFVMFFFEGIFLGVHPHFDTHFIVPNEQPEARYAPRRFEFE